MQVKAQLNYLRIAPRKVRLLADLVRGKKVAEASAILDFSVKRGALPLRKLLDSAVASAKNNFQLDEETLYISKITVDEGPKLKRWRPRARGRAAQIQKKTSHITLIFEGAQKERKRAPEAGEETTEVKEEKLIAEKPKLKKEGPRFRSDFGFRQKFKGRGLKKIFRRKSF